MNLIIEKILSYLSVFVIMAMLSVDMNGTNVGKTYVNDTNSFYFRESTKFMINYLRHYEIGDDALKYRARIFIEKLEKDKNMQAAVAEIVSNYLDEFNLAWLNSLFEELAKNKTEKTLEMLGKPFYEDDCIVNEDGIKCGGTAPNKDALGVTNDIKVEDYMEPAFTNNSLQDYYYGNIIYSPLEKEKLDKNKFYRQNFEDNYHESDNTESMAYHDINLFNEDSSDIQDNRDFKESRYENADPLNLMLNRNNGSTSDQYSYEKESLDEEYSNQERMEKDQIFYTTLGLPHKKESIDNEYYTPRSISENINNAEPQETNIAEKINDYSDEVRNHVVNNYEDKLFSAGNAEENSQSSESKSEKAYYYETYDEEEEIDEKHTRFGRKLLEYNEEDMSEKDTSFEKHLLALIDEVVSEKDTSFENQLFEFIDEERSEHNTSFGKVVEFIDKEISEHNTSFGKVVEFVEEEMSEHNTSFGKVLEFIEKEMSEHNTSFGKVLEFIEEEMSEHNTSFGKVLEFIEEEMSEHNTSFGKVLEFVEEEMSEHNTSFGKVLEFVEEELSEHNTSFGKVLKFIEEEINEFFGKRKLGEESPDDNDFGRSINNEYRIEIPLSTVLSGRRELNRAKRNSDPGLKGCPIPPSLETVQGYCKSIPSGTTCHLYCIKGYTFPEGISRTIQCTPNKGWSQGFEECKPYADCTLKLRSGGTLKCALTTATKNAQCYVSCKRFGLYSAKHQKLYECNSLGLWTPVLPHCVVREGIDLVDTPPFVEHESIEYP